MEVTIFLFLKTKIEIPGAIKVKIKKRFKTAHFISIGSPHREPRAEIKSSKETVNRERSKQ
jgi:hypothetical protein